MMIALSPRSGKSIVRKITYVNFFYSQSNQCEIDHLMGRSYRIENVRQITYRDNLRIEERLIPIRMTRVGLFLSLDDDDPHLPREAFF